jgi:hypothetical protein
MLEPAPWNHPKRDATNVPLICGPAFGIFGLDGVPPG